MSEPQIPRKTPLLGLYKDQIISMFRESGYESWRANQVWEWLYVSAARNFGVMTNIPLKMRDEFTEKYSIELPKISEKKHSIDGTMKFALEVSGGDIVEMVFIPEKAFVPHSAQIDDTGIPVACCAARPDYDDSDLLPVSANEPMITEPLARATLCVSSQIGCLVKCAFCFTGTQRFARNLEAHEIIGQVLLMRDLLGDTGGKDSKRTLTNIVFMGMGEPLHNYENVSRAIKIIMAEDGLAFSRRRITLSTAGVVPYIKRCGEELGVNLAISLHATNDKLRDYLMPINKQFPLSSLLDAVQKYPGINQSRRVTFEYVMLKGMNDSDKDARDLARLISGIPAKVNLIPWNYWPGATFQTSSRERIATFSEILTNCGVNNTVRQQRGVDILAACGQLRTGQGDLQNTDANSAL
jgi:23S rRNA (adenine2503-C2)-methyltransferase